jgi:hypothetical protein
MPAETEPAAIGDHTQYLCDWEDRPILRNGVPIPRPPGSPFVSARAAVAEHEARYGPIVRSSLGAAQPPFTVPMLPLDGSPATPETPPQDRIERRYRIQTDD